MFKGMKDAGMGRPKTWMDYGRYLVELTEMFAKNSEQDGSPLFVCRFKVVESDNPKHPPGSDGSWSLKGKPLQYGQGDIKALILSIMKIDPRALSKDAPEHATASLLFRYVLGSETARQEIEALPKESRIQSNFYVGKRARLETKPKSSDNAFTRHFWSPA